MHKTSIRREVFTVRRRIIFVKGISKQVIVVQSPDRELFDQAIFILKDEAVGKGVTEELLLKEAQRVINAPAKKRQLRYYGPVWACGGALVTGIVWLLTVMM